MLVCLAIERVLDWLKQTNAEQENLNLASFVESREYTKWKKKIKKKETKMMMMNKEYVKWKVVLEILRD